jgi:hypothetical protein
MIKPKPGLLLSVLLAATCAASMLAVTSYLIGSSDGKLGPLLKASGEISYKPNLGRISRPTISLPLPGGDTLVLLCMSSAVTQAGIPCYDSQAMFGHFHGKRADVIYQKVTAFEHQVIAVEFSAARYVNQSSGTKSGEYPVLETGLRSLQFLFLFALSLLVIHGFRHFSSRRT